MATLNDTIMAGLRLAMRQSKFDTMTATYDGLDGELTMTWTNPAGTYAAAFYYEGQSNQELSDILRETAGMLFAEYNYDHNTSRQDWVDSITDE